MKRIFSIVLTLALLLGTGSAFAIDAGHSRAVIGANLNEAEINSVYSTFGISRGSVTELTVTNPEERQYLDGLVDSSRIGTRSISCVYIETLSDGSGLNVSAYNTDWCGRDMYINALATAGITDAKVIVTAPFVVSGTAALTGIYKAYEDITGEKLSEEAKLAGTHELVITAELADQIGEYDATTIVNELKLVLDETKNMSDDELREQIVSISSSYNISITDSQISQLISLCRSFEKLDTAELKARVESLQNTIKTLANAQETAGKVSTSIKNFFKAIGDFFSNLFK